MNFDEFTGSIVEALKQELGDTRSVVVMEALKNNGVRRTGIVITGEGDNVSPTIYLEEPYRRYQAGVPVGKIAEEIGAVYQEHANVIDLDINFFMDFTLVEGRIFHKLINYEKNKELLKDVPYFRWHDLAVVFYYAMEDAKIGKASIMIHNSHLRIWEQTAEELYRIARRNMEQKMPELLLPIQVLLGGLLEVEAEEDVLPVYVLTNREMSFGASVMLYSRQMKELADGLNSDLLILPSSLHEVLLLPDDRVQNYGYYKQIVKEVNKTKVEPEEVLSYKLYRYNREKDEIEKIVV